MAMRNEEKAEARPPRSAAVSLAKLIAVLSIVLPAIIFAVASVLSWNTHYDNARKQLEAQADLVVQHARRIFATFELAASQTQEAMLGETNADVAEQNADLSARLHRLSAALPEVEDIWVLDATGRPVVTSVVTPAPREVDFSSQDFFAAQRDPATGVYISERTPGYFRPSRFFKVSYRRNTAEGGFAGAIVLSGDPRSFEPFYDRMLSENLSAVGLVLEDGAILARVPNSDGPTRMPPGSAFMISRAAHPEGGFYNEPSPVDGVKRLTVFRAVSPLPVYAVVALNESVVRARWLQAMESHLYFGLPATLALFGISLAAIRQARRQSEILADLQREEERRAFAEEALRQANKMEAIGRLTGGVAHDFNNLLQVMLGRLSRIHKAAERQAPPALRDIDAMQFAIDRAANLTHRLLAFSRQQPLRRDIVDANALLAGMTELVRQTAGAEVAVETIYATDLWPVSVDPNQLENAILNLTSNARDAMQGAGRITIRTENVAVDGDMLGPEAADVEPGDYVCISLADTGQGIPSELIDKIFEPFFTTKPVGQGTGLGLSMVYGFLRQSGGHVTVASEMGRGTIVSLLLPRVEGEANASAPEDGAVPADGAASGLILVVEDEVEVRRLVVDTLRDAGYTVLAAPTAQRGLSLIEDNPSVQLLLSDIGLPDGMSGVELAEAARRLRPRLRIVLMTGYARAAGDVGAALDASSVLAKPFTREALMRRIGEALATQPVEG